MAEVVTTGISGYSHWKLGNVDWKLVRRLLVPGVIGGGLGAYILTSIDGNSIEPYIAIYLLIMGGVIIYKAFTIKPRKKPDEYHGPRISLLGLFGGFCDAIGGGGWGPVVTSTLVARGKNPRMTIGSVNFSEFFVTLGQSILFVLTLSFGEYWRVILGLLIGGAIAAPIAAKLAQKLPLKALMIFVGILIIALSIRTLYLAIK
ncbi:sulfite exporter TauE/SafE family protein [Candidatus Villigracilis proximus]|uniref:sulfite exporter TauE/SafE family protein n=1 Tax=Candidatus Villigracilis proximus TaxID=3140683 RepID=UPI0031EE2857